MSKMSKEPIIDVCDWHKMGEKKLDIDAIIKYIDQWAKRAQYCNNTACKKAFFCKRSVVHLFPKTTFITPEKNGECGFFIPRTARKPKVKND